MEIEFKRSLHTMRDAMSVYAACQGTASATVWQFNHFFDTHNLLLNQNKTTIRLREERRGQHSTFWLTIKMPTTSILQTEAHVHEEFECAIEEKFFHNCLETISDYRQLLFKHSFLQSNPHILTTLTQRLHSEPLSYRGTFHNERTAIQCSLPTGLATNPFYQGIIEIDRTEYFHKYVHYEVEMEIKDMQEEAAAAAAFQNLLIISQVNHHEAVGKAKRFFAYSIQNH